MKCEKCGRDNADVHNYCIHCGAVLERKAVKAVRRRMGFFKRLLLQLLIIVLVLAGAAYWLGTRNIISVQRNADNAYTAYFSFVGRVRLFAPDDGDMRFSESKVAGAFPDGAKCVRVRLDACHYGVGGEPTLNISIAGLDDKGFTPVHTSEKLPEDNCVLDRDITIYDGPPLPPGKYLVQFSIAHPKENPIILKSLTFTIEPSAK